LQTKEERAKDKREEEEEEERKEKPKVIHILRYWAQFLL
jgi:hypothetical protein